MNNSLFFNNLCDIKTFLVTYFDSNYQKISLDDNFSNLQTNLKEGYYTMESFAWQSEKVGYCRLTYLSQENSKIEMLNLTIYPNITLKSQMFVTDFVFLNNHLRVGVIDIMPIFDDITITTQQNLYQKSLFISPVYERKLDWSFEFLSPFACLATQTPQNSVQDLYALWYQYFLLYQTHINNCDFSGDIEQEFSKNFQNDYNAKHLSVVLKRNPLKHYFGEEKMNYYFENFLFKKIFD